MILTTAQISVASSKVFCKLGNGTVRDLTLDTNTVYSHPAAIQCNAATEINSLKSFVSNGKQQVANAITDKGVSASGNDSFATLANKISQIQSLTAIDTAARARTSMTGGSSKSCKFEYVAMNDLNLYYGSSIEYYFEGVFSNGIGNWDTHYGTLSWDDYNRQVDCQFRASYSPSTLNGSVSAVTASTGANDLQVKSATATTYNGHPAVDVTLTVENAIHWWSFGGTSETARVIVYCTEWSDVVKIGSYSLGRIYYST